MIFENQISGLIHEPTKYWIYDAVISRIRSITQRNPYSVLFPELKSFLLRDEFFPPKIIKLVPDDSHRRILYESFLSKSQLPGSSQVWRDALRLDSPEILNQLERREASVLPLIEKPSEQSIFDPEKKDDIRDIPFRILPVLKESVLKDKDVAFYEKNIEIPGIGKMPVLYLLIGGGALVLFLLLRD